MSPAPRMPMKVSSRCNFDALALESSAHRPATRKDPRKTPRGTGVVRAAIGQEVELSNQMALPEQKAYVDPLAMLSSKPTHSLLLDVPPSSSLFNSLGLVDCQRKAAGKKKAPKVKAATSAKRSVNEVVGQSAFDRAPGSQIVWGNAVPVPTAEMEESKVSREALALLSAENASSGDILAHHIRELLRQRAGPTSPTQAAVSHTMKTKKVANSSLSTAAPTRDLLPEVEVPGGRLISPGEESLSSCDDVKLFNEAPVLLSPKVPFIQRYDFY